MTQNKVTHGDPGLTDTPSVIHEYSSTTQDNKEIEELAKKYARQYYLVSEENHPEKNATKALADLVEYHHQQLQKARQEWLFELTEGVMIGSDGNRKCYFIPCERLDRYKSELDQNTNKTP